MIKEEIWRAAVLVFKCRLKGLLVIEKRIQGSLQKSFNIMTKSYMISYIKAYHSCSMFIIPPYVSACLAVGSLQAIGRAVGGERGLRGALHMDPVPQGGDSGLPGDPVSSPGGHT